VSRALSAAEESRFELAQECATGTRNMKTNALSALQIKKLTRPGLYTDGGGLALQVQPGPSKAWVFRYMLDRKPHKMGLGPLALVSLAEAREKALSARRLLLAGIDPLQARADEQAKAAAEALKAITFKQCAERFIAAHKPSWKNPKHADQWDSTIATYAEPLIGALAVQAVDTTSVMRVLEQERLDKKKKPTPLWQLRPETAYRLRGRIEQILDWATARGYRSGENPARWRGHIDKLLPGRSKIVKRKHHPALPYSEIGDFIATLRDREGTAARALEFTILTTARTSEVIGARRSEFDLKNRMWIVPGARMKSGRDHRVPLSERALEIISTLPDEGESVFTGRHADSALSNMAMLKLLQRDLQRPDLTVHGFRSTFRDWASEMTAFANEVLEMALAHVVSDETEAAYRRGDLLEKRRRLMADWATYCATASNAGDVVVPIRALS
jgi:integrase